MYHFKKSLIWIWVGIGFLSIQARCIETIDVHYIKEEINDSTFEHRQDIVNGACKETWLVDAKKVTAEHYEEAILNAEKEVRRQERRARLEHYVKEQELRAQSQFALNKKILHELINDIEQRLSLLQEYDLEPFITFNNDFSKDTFDALSLHLLPEAKRLVGAHNRDIELMNIKDAIDKLEVLPPKLSTLFYKALDYATKVCSDTKKLKRLLELTVQT